MDDLVITCDAADGRYRFACDRAPRDDGWPVPARDVSSPYVGLEASGPPAVSLLLLGRAEAAAREHWERLLAALTAAAGADEPGSPVLAPVAFGPVPDGPHAGRWVMACRPWADTLAGRLRQGPLTADEVVGVYRAVAGGLFRLHRLGHGHGGVTAEAVVRTADGWKLGSGATPPVAPDPAIDVAAAGGVLAAAVGVPAPAGAAGGWADAWVRWFESLTASPPAHPGRWFGRPAGGLERPAVVPPEWGPVLAGCLNRDPGRRWTAARLLLGGQPLPAVDRLWLATDGRTAEVSWDPPAFGEAAVYPVPAAGAVPAGAVVPATAVAGYGPPLPAGGGAVRLPAAEPRRVQVLTHWGEVVVGGAAVNVSPLPDVSGVEAVTAERGLWVRWEWPPGATVARVVVRADRFADGPEDGAAVEVGRAVYESGGGIGCPVPAAGAWLHLAVFTVRRAGGRLVASSGATVGARWEGVGRPVRVRYRLDPDSPAGPGPRAYLLRLTADTDVWLPEVQLVAGPAGGSVRAAVPAGVRATAGREARVRVWADGDLGQARAVGPAGPAGAGFRFVAW